MNPSRTNEIQLPEAIALLALTRHAALKSTPKSVSEVQKIFPSKPENLLRHLAWHNLLGLVESVLPRTSFSTEQNRYCDRILSRTHDNVETLRQKWKQLADFLDSLEVEYIPVKGICHLQHLYDSSELRNMGDIDLIVRTEEVPRIVRELHLKWQGVPYEHFPAATRFRWHRVFAPIDEFAIARLPLGRTPVHFIDFAADLHWSPHYGPSVGGLRLDNHNLFETSEAWPEMGKNARSLRPNADLAFCVLHAATSEHKILVHLVDIIRLWKRYGLAPRDVVKTWKNLESVSKAKELLELIEGIADPEIDLRSLSQHPIMTAYFQSEVQYAHLLTLTNPQESARFSLYFERLRAQKAWKARVLYTLGFLLPSQEYLPQQRLPLRTFKFYIQWIFSGVAAVKKVFRR